MLSRAMKVAVADFLAANIAGKAGSCEVRIVPPPGRPTGCSGIFAITIWDNASDFTSNIGFYGSYAVNVTVTYRTKCTPADRLDSVLDSLNGAGDVRDWIAAFLHNQRYLIMEYTNAQMDAAYRGGIYNGLTEAPRPLHVSPWELKTPEWFQEAQPATKAPMPQMSQMAAYASTIVYGNAGLFQTPELATG